MWYFKVIFYLERQEKYVCNPSLVGVELSREALALQYKWCDRIETHTQSNTTRDGTMHHAYHCTVASPQHGKGVPFPVRGHGQAGEA